MIVFCALCALILSALVWASCLLLEDEDDSDGDYVPENKFYRNDEGDDDMKVGFAVGRIQGRTGIVRSQQGEVKVSYNATLDDEVKRVEPVVEVMPVQVELMPWVKNWSDKKIKGAHIDVSI